MRISDWSSDVCSSDLQNDIAAVLYGEGVACAFFGSRTIDPHTDMPNDDVMCLFDDDRGDTVRAARMGTCDAASGCGLAGYGQIGIADYGRTAGETDQPGHANDADARSARLYAGAIGAGPIIRPTGDEQNAEIGRASGRE